MRPTVLHRCDTVAMKQRTATVEKCCPTRTYARTVADRCDPGQSRARTGVCAHARAETFWAQWEPSRRCATVTAFSARKLPSLRLSARDPQAKAEMAQLCAMNRYFPALSAAEARGNSGGWRMTLFRLSGFQGGHGARHVGPWANGRSQGVPAYVSGAPFAPGGVSGPWGPTPGPRTARITMTKEVRDED
jgi:hypothetical protein